MANSSSPWANVTLLAIDIYLILCIQHTYISLLITYVRMSGINGRQENLQSMDRTFIYPVDLQEEVKAGDGKMGLQLQQILLNQEGKNREGVEVLTGIDAKILANLGEDPTDQLLDAIDASWYEHTYMADPISREVILEGAPGLEITSDVLSMHEDRDSTDLDDSILDEIESIGAYETKRRSFSPDKIL